MDLEFPCGCEFHIFVSRDGSAYSTQVEDDGYDHELCEIHMNEIKFEYEKTWGKENG